MLSLNGEESGQNSSDYNTRQRLESCTHGIQQLEALRLKHKLLMEQIRRDYPSMTSLIKSLSGDESDPIAAQNSPSSACSSAPSQISDDSGYDQHNSGSTGFCEPIMDYSTFRKISLEEHQTVRKNPRPSSTHIVEATLKNLTSQQLPSTSDYYNSSTWSRLHKRRNPLNSNPNRPKSCYGSTTSQQESESGRPTSMILCGAQLRDSKLLDSNVFAQITPPMLQRKFATSQSAVQKLEDPPQIQVKQLPKRETPVLKPKIMSSRSVKLQRAELRTLPASNPSSAVSSPKLTPKLKPKQTSQAPVKSWQQSFANQQQAKRQHLDSTVVCSNDVPRFSISNKVPSPSMSRVASAVRSLNKNFSHEAPNYDKWKNVASVAPMQKSQTTYSTQITNGCTTFPSTRKSQMPLVGMATISKPKNLTQQQTYTSSCSLSLGASFKKPIDPQPFIRMRQAGDWHTTEKL